MGGLENYAAWWDWKWVLKGREGSKPQTPVRVAGLLWMWALHVQGRVYSGGIWEGTQDCSSGSTSVSLRVMWARWGALGGTLQGLHKSERLGAGGCLTVRQDTRHRNWELGICRKINGAGGEGSRAKSGCKFMVVWAGWRALRGSVDFSLCFFVSLKHSKI